VVGYHTVVIDIIFWPNAQIGLGLAGSGFGLGLSAAQRWHAEWSAKNSNCCDDVTLTVNERQLYGARVGADAVVRSTSVHAHVT